MFDANNRLLPVGALAVGSGPAAYLRVGNSPRPMFVNIVANGVVGTGTLTFTVSHSDDGTTWFVHTSAADQAVTLGAAQDLLVVLPVLTTKPYLRVDVNATTITAGTMPDGARLGIVAR